jgi:hypothetical protein
VSQSDSAERTYLAVGIEKLETLLKEYGFDYYPGDQAVSSGGRFALGFFRRGNLEIGLIVRHQNELGCPNYSEGGEGYAGHDDLFWALGKEGESMLVPGQDLAYVARDGGDPFDALLSDLEHVILPAIQKSDADFSRARARAHKKFQDQLRGRSG